MYNRVSVTFICLYLPPFSKQNTNTNKMFLDEFLDFLHPLSDRRGEVIVMGDFHFHFDKQHDSELCKLKSLLNDCCLQQFVGHPNHRSGHTLDWMMTLSSSTVLTVVIDTALSDHRTVFCSFSLRLSLIHI